MKRRTMLLAGAGTAALIMTEGRGLTAYAAPGATGTATDWLGRFDRPQQGFEAADTVLREVRPAQANLDPVPLQQAWAQIESFKQPQADGFPMYPGAVLCCGHHGRLVFTEATGSALLYADGDGTVLPAEQQIAAETDTIYDLASISKLFTSIVIMQLVQAGKLELNQTMANYVPEFGVNGKSTVTLRMLLTHTSGFKPDIPLWSDYPDVPSRINAVLSAELTNPPGSTYLYSDLNLISLGILAQRITGKRLDVLVEEGIAAPLQMSDTGYNPDPSLKPRIAATEYQLEPPRGLVWGQVHDENSWSLDGVAGHAGVFSSVADLAVLSQTMLNGGSYRGTRILSEASVQQMIDNDNENFPGDEHGLGFELDQRWYMGGLSSIRTAGHTGYTGTSIVIDFLSRSFVILLTNRVHPSRNWGSNNPSRRAATQGLAEALAVCPAHGRDCWFSGDANANTATLTWTLGPRASHTHPGPGPGRAQEGAQQAPVSLDAQLSFEAFIDTESTDRLGLESSTDGGTTWQPLAWQLDGAQITGPYAQSGVRQWQPAKAVPPTGTDQLRWSYVTDALYSGRGVYLDELVITQGAGTDSAEIRPSELIATGGWHLARR